MNLAAWKVEDIKGQISLLELGLSSEHKTCDSVSLTLPGGAYTTFRTFEHDKALRLEDHFQRLEDTAELLGRPVNIERDGLRLALRRVIQQFKKQDDLRIRLSIDLEEHPGTAFIVAKILETPPVAAYEQGVAVITCHLQRRLPKAKLTRFIARADLVRQNLPIGVNEALMADQSGHFLEGLSSNFFAVMDGVLWTADKGVLSGITRSLVLEEAERAGIPLQMECVRVNDVASFYEAFITSSSRAILPVRQIDQAIIGSGKPGEITRCLMEGYTRRLHQDVRPV